MYRKYGGHSKRCAPSTRCFPLMLTITKLGLHLPNQFCPPVPARAAADIEPGSPALKHRSLPIRPPTEQRNNRYKSTSLLPARPGPLHRCCQHRVDTTGFELFFQGPRQYAALDIPHTLLGPCSLSLTGRLVQSDVMIFYYTDTF